MKLNATFYYPMLNIRLAVLVVASIHSHDGVLDQIGEIEIISFSAEL